MSYEQTLFPAGIDFESVLRIISKQIYETPFAFVRENVQNAVDAVRIQTHRDAAGADDPRYRIEITVEGRKVIVRDNGVGMSSADVRNYFWTIGASGKRTAEALAAGCVGTFGIGGFANFGVCEVLEVISQDEVSSEGTLTRLSEQDIRAAGTTIPSVTMETSDAAAPRGTVVTGYLREPPDVGQLRDYLRDFVRFVPTAIYFNGQKVSQGRLSEIEDRDNFSQVRDGTQDWRNDDLAISGRMFEDRGHGLVAVIEGLRIGGEPTGLTGHLRFENGLIDVFKRGFKLCATQVGSTIGVSGRLDCDSFVPTAGRDSLDSETTGLLGRIVHTLEEAAIEAVLETPERVAQHTRIFRYILRHGLVERIGNVNVRLADGSENLLGDIRLRARDGGVGVYFGVAQNQALNQVMQARGHLVVLLSSDRHRQNAERRYLEQFCNAKPFDGVVDCVEHYDNLSRFEKVFLSELELDISKSYEITDFRLIAGKLTEDIPVFLKESGGKIAIDIFVDVRHQEVAKLKELGFTQILYSLIGTFCREYLGPSLKKWSPRFFGDGALNLELLAKRRSELWVLLKNDIGVVRKGGHRQVVTQSDVRVMNIVGGGGGQTATEPQADKPNPRILQIVDEQRTTSLAGYYIRLPDAAFSAYGDLLPECESRGVVWAGNKILYVVSDAASASFQYEIRLDEVVAADVVGTIRAEGAIQLDRLLQEIYGGLYFPIPRPLERFMVPKGDDEIRLELHCDWIDMRTAKHWAPRQPSTEEMQGI
ncbi:MAG: ATP-binding protein [Alphaproteobacteria bacterium]|nr:ATP-binding protein [Alphaproteobacteria bacterium]